MEIIDIEIWGQEEEEEEEEEEASDKPGKSCLILDDIVCAFGFLQFVLWPHALVCIIRPHC